MSDVSNVVHSKSLAQLGQNLQKAFSDLLSIAHLSDAQKASLQVAANSVETLAAQAEQEIVAAAQTAATSALTSLAADFESRIAALETKVAPLIESGVTKVVDGAVADLPKSAPEPVEPQHVEAPSAE